MATLCIDLGGSAVKIALVDGSQMLATTEFPVSGSADDLDNVRDSVAELTRASSDHGTSTSRAAATRAPAHTIDRVGIALPGVVDRSRGCLVVAHDKYDWAIGFDIRSWAEREFGGPTIIENDGRAALAGEVAFGCARGETDVVMIVLGTGIGTAALIDGTLLRGKHDHAGILGGHVTVDIDAGDCNCGNVGCAESVASSWALERAVREHPRFDDSAYWAERLAAGRPGIKALVDAPDDAIRRDVLARFCRIWAATIVSLCHAYDPDTVVVSGGVMRSGDLIMPALTDYVGRHLWSSSHRPRLVSPTEPEHSVVLGLAAIANHDLPDTPERTA